MTRLGRRPRNWIQGGSLAALMLPVCVLLQSGAHPALGGVAGLVALLTAIALFLVGAWPWRDDPEPGLVLIPSVGCLAVAGIHGGTVADARAILGSASHHTPNPANGG